MTGKVIFFVPRMIVLTMALALAMLAGRQAFAQEKVLYSFPVGDYFQGVIPSALSSDSAGNLYGTTIWGGGEGCVASGGCGEVF
jgi:hypothetical protein